MQVDHIRNDFVHIPFSTSVQEGGSFSVAEGVNFGFSRTFDDAGPPPGTPVFFFQGILGRSRPEIGRLHRKCGRTHVWLLRDVPGSQALEVIPSRTQSLIAFPDIPLKSAITATSRRSATTWPGSWQTRRPTASSR